MAKTNWQDPQTSEIRSTHISGLQEAAGKIQESLNMESVFEEAIILAEVFIAADDRCRIYQASEGKRNWLASPTPIVYKNENIITEGFELDYGGGAVIFVNPNEESDIITVDAAYIKSESVVNKNIEVTKSPIGFPNRTDSTFSFDKATRTFTIEPIGESYEVFFKDKRFIKTEPESIIIPNETGLYFIYFNKDTGALSYNTTIPGLDNMIYVSYIYWNASQATASLQFGPGDERHGTVMDKATHQRLHSVDWTQWVSGLQLYGYALNDSSNNNGPKVSITNGFVADEDLQHYIAHSPTPSAFFEQVLQDFALLPVLYRDGAAGEWKQDAANAYPFKNTASGRINYNQYYEGSWKQTQLGSGQFVAYYIIFAADIEQPIKVVQGQRTDNSLSNAQANNDDRNIQWGNMPFQEAKVLFRLIFETNDTFTNERKTCLRDVLDLRAARRAPGGGGIIPSAHSNLTGLDYASSGHIGFASDASVIAVQNQVTEHETEITSLQNEVLNTIARASVPLSNTAPVQSFSADVAGPVDASFTAPDMIANGVVNGNFANGTTGWLSAGSTSTATNNIASNTGNGADASPQFYQQTNALVQAGKKFYAKSTVRVTNAVALNVKLVLEGTAGGAVDIVSISNPVQNQWYTLSGVITVTSQTGNALINNRHGYTNAATANGKSMEIQQVMLVDLTSIFGSGNEPSQAWCDTNISYVNGIQPLVNPMVKISGKNLVVNGNCENGINGWVLQNGSGNAKFTVSNNKFSVLTGNSNTDFVYQVIRVKPTVNYYVKYNGNTNANIRVYEYVSLSPLTFGNLNRDGSGVFSSNSGMIVILLGSLIGTGGGTFTFDAIQIEEATSPTTYEPHKESSIILPGEFCKIGNYADTVKFENGVAKKLAAVKKMMLDGSLNWVFAVDYVGYKSLKILPLIPGNINIWPYSKLFKYDGTVYNTADPVAQLNQFALYADTGNFYISISDSDSGWGETYTPTSAEIQALMNGWKMNNGTFGTPYNGSGTKTWTTWNATSNTGAVTTIPTTKASDWASWATLWYALTNPVEKIIDTIGSLGCFTGQNTISVETGMVYEKVNPITDASGRWINVTALPASWFKYKSNRISGVFKNGTLDPSWSIDTSAGAYGKYFAYKSLTAEFDPTAEYYVLYQMLPEEYNNQQISLTAYYPSNLRGAQNALAETVIKLQNTENLHENNLITDGNGVHGLVYEEGTWTPYFYGSTTAGTNTYTIQSGIYRRLGKQIFISIELTINVKDTAMAGDIYIGGLPFLPVNNGISLVIGSISKFVNDTTKPTITALIIYGLPYIILRKNGEADTVNIPSSAMQNGTHIRISGIYPMK